MLTGGTSFARSGFEAGAFDLGVDAWGGVGFDPAASNYIAALGRAGVMPTDLQRNAVNAFIKREKLMNRWDLHKRLYLPIWGVAAANAICMKSLTSGTFVGGVTHAAGYVQGDGVTGVFDYLQSATSLGLTVESGLIFSLATNFPAAGTFYLISGSDATGSFHLSTTVSNYSGRIGGTTNALLSITRTTTIQEGVITASRTSVSLCSVKRRNTQGVVTGSNLTTNPAAIPTQNIIAMAQRNSGVISNYFSGRMGAHGVGFGIDGNGCDAFSLALKTLWETCTGLTLP